MKKANDKSKENNKPKLESNSFSSANKRSHKFDSLLNQSSRPNTTNFKSISPRERFKKIWQTEDRNNITGKSEYNSYPVCRTSWKRRTGRV